jgi:hypothetical protein
MIPFLQSIVSVCSESTFWKAPHQPTPAVDDQEIAEFINCFLDSSEIEQEQIARRLEQSDSSLRHISQRLREKDPELFASLFSRIGQAANRTLTSSTANQAASSDLPPSKTTEEEEEDKIDQLRSKGHAAQDPIRIEANLIDDSAALSRPNNSQILPPHGGIGNTRNTCYAASLAQALESLEVCQFDKSPIGKALSSFIDELRKSGPESPLEASKINALVETFTEHGWPKKLGAFGDPQELMHFLQPHLCGKQEWTVHNIARASSKDTQASIEQMIRYIPEGTSLQDILSGTFSGARQQFEITPDGKPDYFVLTLSGREPCPSRDGSPRKDPDTRRISLSPAVFLPHKGHGQQEFLLSSVVMHQPNHYCLLKPRFDERGNLVGWVRFNDSVASIHPNSPSLTSLVEQQGYMFFYRKKEQQSRRVSPMIPHTIFT